MFASSVVLRRNLLSRTQHLKPLTVYWKSQKTLASPLENLETSNGVPTRSFEDIPGPSGLKFMMDLLTKSEGFTKGYKIFQRLFEEHGPIYKESLTMKPAVTVHVIDPEDFEKVFRAEGKYPRRPVIDVWAEHRKRRNYFLGIGQLDGKEWQRVRQTIAPKIMRPKMVEENIDNFNAVSKDAIERFAQLKAAGGPDDHIPDLEGELSMWSTEGMGTVAFDSRLGLYKDCPPQEALEFIREVRNFMKLSQKLTFNIPSRMARPYMDTPTFKKFLKSADACLDIGQEFVDNKMRELKEMAEKGIDLSDSTQVVPLLTYLLTKEDVTPEEVNGHAIDVVVAGVDTTSSTVLWWLYNLARFPHVQENLYQEVKSVVGKYDDITPKHLAKLFYLKACLKESMRLTPSIPNIPRILDQDVVLSGYHVPAQTLVYMELYSTTRSENYFEDPLEFRPERWLRENKDKINAFSNLPFGFGTRMCVGRRVAELEMYVFICKLLQRFRLEYNHEPLELCQKMLTVPDKPVKIKFVDRV